MGNATASARLLTRARLARWPLPALGDNADKEARGHVLIIAGSEEIPGAALLAAVAALRAGAGKLTIAAPSSIAQGLAIAVPESRVIALAQARTGGLLAAGAAALADIAAGVNAVVAGPGMQNEKRTVAFLRRLLPLFAHCTVVLDALAMSVASDEPFAQPIVLTPHAGELAYMTGRKKASIQEQPLMAAREAATKWNACVALKGATTFIALPGSDAWQFNQSRPGLATSGSGDTLAGLIGGLLARGLPSHAACAWGVMTHARSGASLSRSHGPLGYLARELAGEIPNQLRALSR
jgi:hydroxyethylthiazole kinase-like uncharacterized protein yjeF